MGIVILFVAFIALIGIYILVIEFPAVIDVIISATQAILFYIGQALDIVWVFVPRTSTLLFMGICITVEAIYLGYLFILWILKKIPVANIK